MDDEWASPTENQQSSNVKTTSKVASISETFTKDFPLNIDSKDCMVRSVGGNVALFLLKLAALETTRRLSRAKCPFAWRSLQAFQMLCYPPFKWIRRWAPFKGLVQGLQMFSRPFLILSIASAFSDMPEKASPSNDRNVPDPCANVDKETSSGQPSIDTRSNDESFNHPPSENWLVKLYEELGSQGINLPERINENALRRFYEAADGNFSCLLASVKKTVRWRETYAMLSQEELRSWSNVVFWHGYDVRHRPCLIVRLGLACSTLPAHERPRFSQAIVSQMEHGILHLANYENPRTVVLVDCEGISPFRLPMQMMRSCSLLFQDHFPNCLGALFVIRLPPVVRMMAVTIIKVLKPVTRQKLKFIGDRYQEVLAEYFQELPACFGGTCTCLECSSVTSYNTQLFSSSALATDLITDGFRYEDTAAFSLASENDIRQNFEQVLRTAVMGILMFCVFIAFLAGMNDSERRPNSLS